MGQPQANKLRSPGTAQLHPPRPPLLWSSSSCFEFFKESASGRDEVYLLPSEGRMYRRSRSSCRGVGKVKVVDHATGSGSSTTPPPPLPWSIRMGLHEPGGMTSPHSPLATACMMEPPPHSLPTHSHPPSQRPAASAAIPTN